MTRKRCCLCPRTATRSVRSYDVYQYHYAKIDTGRAEFSAMAAWDHPPYKRLDRLQLVGASEEVLGAEKVQEILGHTMWFQRIETIRAKAREIFKGARQ